MPRYNARDGEPLFYRKLGQGKPVVLLHGFGMQSSHWLPFAWLLSRKNTVILPDMRGFGRSHHCGFNQDCSLSNYADDLEDLMQALNLKSVRLGGISMGALTSLKYLEQYGQNNIHSYLHIDQSPCCTNTDEWKWGLFGNEHTDRLERAKQLLAELNPYVERRADYHDLPTNLKQAIRSELGEFFATALSKPSHKTVARALMNNEFFASRIMPTKNWTMYMRCLQAYIDQGYDLRESLQHIDIPIHLLVGMKSEMYPAAGQVRFADYLKNPSLIAFTKSGHTPLIDQPLKFAQELTRFANA